MNTNPLFLLLSRYKNLHNNKQTYTPNNQKNGSQELKPI